MQLVDSSSENYKYDVFLSFRGEDTRKTFTDHLYKALLNEGLAAFRDDEGMDRGETITSALENAIHQSKSWIIVFSKNYAGSRWCLDELALILDCMNNSKRLLLPIFYHVDPSHIRKQSGGISEALQIHEEKFEREVDDTRKKDLMDKINRWRTALTQLGNLKGETFPNGTNGYESEFIQDIVNRVNDKVGCNILSITPHLVGINASAKDINLWVRNGSTDVEVFALYGIGGVGKTTIAKYVYNTNLELFEGGSFLESIREYSERSDGLVCLQRQLLSDISKGKTPTINNLNDGLRKLRNAIRGKKLLIVLDDVDQVEQLDAINGMRECFHPGSKIILTTRDKDLLQACEPCTRHVVNTLNVNDSLELFSCHAFRDSHPPEYYIEHLDRILEPTQRILEQCQGLPLALEVLGAYLRDKELDVWRSAIEELEVIPHYKIRKILQISYESLQDDHDRDLFLDVACFFNGEAKSQVVMILDECKYHTRIGIEKLIDRCLLRIDIFGNLRMHHLIQSMGREIIRQQSPKEPGERSRLWHCKDSLEVLEDETGTRAIEGLALEMNRTNACPVELRTSAFSMMHKLRLLKLDNVWLTGGYEDFPKRLKWLYWHGCPLKALPKGFPSTSLVAIDMQRSKLQKLGQGSMLLGSLKFLNLSHCHDLVKSPNFAELNALEQLVLEDCVSLVEIDESIGMAERLVLLDLKDCKLLKTLPKNIGMLKHLETLIISGCSNLNTLPEEMPNMESLKVLLADGLDIGNSSNIIQESKSWRDYIWGWVSKQRTGRQLSLTSLPYKYITELSLVDCNLHDNDFPKVFGHSVEDLDLSKNPICFLPDCFKGLKRLKTLRAEYCKQLQALEIPNGLAFIHIMNCPLLEKITILEPGDVVEFLSTFFYQDAFLSTFFYPLGCKKLVELLNRFRMVPIGDVDSELIDSCGIYDLDVKKRIQIKLYNRYTLEIIRCPVQGIFEAWLGGKAFSIFYPGSRVPVWFTSQHNASSRSFIWSTSEHNVSSIFFIVSPHSKLRYLNTCIVYKFNSNSHTNFLPTFWLRINNMTKDKEIKFCPFCYGIPDGDEYMTWISHFKFGIQEVELESGDEIDISVFTNRTNSGASFELKELRINTVYDMEEEDFQQTLVNIRAVINSDSYNQVD